MTIGWAESYLGQLRALAGDRVLLFVGARCLLRDEAGRLLLIKRRDNGYWALPAGALEVGESVAECAGRELFEETGLTATALTPVVLYSGAPHIHTDMYGHTYQLHVTAFRVDAWDGDLQRETDETTDAQFFPIDALPRPLAASVPPTVADLASFERTGRLVLA